MLDVQRLSRAAFGYDNLDETIARTMPHVSPDSAGAASATGTRQCRETRPKGQIVRRLIGSAWPWRIAAVLAIAASSYVAITAQRSVRNLENCLADLKRPTIVPQIGLTAADIARYRAVWHQVSDGGSARNMWILLNNDAGEFGSIVADPSATAIARGKVLLVQYRILNEAGRHVYTADLLIPDTAPLQVKLPDVGRIAGKLASLTVSTEDDRATVGFSVGRHDAMPAGVAGQMLIDMAGEEVGSFNLNGENLRVFARTRRLSGFQS